ncbi:hypothetical protein DMENIID0001_136610 [Sergentomyia squamirostris]
MTKIMDERRPPESPGDLAWTKLLDDNNAPSPVLVKIDDSHQKESPTSSDPPNVRRQSILGAFQRQIRLSLKAVSDSPGPITRIDAYSYKKSPPICTSLTDECKEKKRQNEDKAIKNFTAHPQQGSKDTVTSLLGGELRIYRKTHLILVGLKWVDFNMLGERTC